MNTTPFANHTVNDCSPTYFVVAIVAGIFGAALGCAWTTEVEHKQIIVMLVNDNARLREEAASLRYPKPPDGYRLSAGSTPDAVYFTPCNGQCR